MCHQANASDGNPLASRKAKGCHGGSSRAEIPSIVKVMGELASDPTAQPQSRLKAIDVLLRAAATDHPASSDAKAHLSRSRSFLDQLIQSRDSPNNRLRRAASLSRRIADLIR
jgi:hypothetical protein